MNRQTLTRSGLAALVALVVYLLIGGGIDLGDDDSSQPETTTTQTLPGPTPTQPADTQTQPAPQPKPQPDGSAAISEDEAREISRVLALIESGGPFPHDRDGITFENREGLLPQQPRAYYKEYTVETPGSDDRGARRLVVGEGGETYYTRDHYESFIPIDPADFK